jgi:hypothetical protein
VAETNKACESAGGGVWIEWQWPRKRLEEKVSEYSAQWTLQEKTRLVKQNNN